MLSCSEKYNYYLMNSIAWAQGTCYSFTVVLGFLSEKKKIKQGPLELYLFIIYNKTFQLHVLSISGTQNKDGYTINFNEVLYINNLFFSKCRFLIWFRYLLYTLSIVSLSSSLINSWPKPWVSLFTMAIFNPYGALPMQTQKRMICIDGRINWNRRNLMKKKKFVHCNSILFNQEIFFLPRVIQSP